VPLPRLSRILRRLVAVVLLVAVVVVAGTATRIWWVARQDDRRTSDVIVVLGASQFDGRPSSVFEARLEHAKTLYEARVAPRVITVGGSAPGDRFTEAAAGKTYLQDNGVPDVVAVGEGRDTLESLRALERTMVQQGWRTAVLVTDPWHSLRSRAMARDLDIDAVTSPTRRGPSVRTRGTEVRYIGRETAAYLYYRAFGRSSDGGPRAV
jgi:uncharacterized SAM-binding protein YcdF (DUF218 family)